MGEDAAPSAGNGRHSCNSCHLNSECVYTVEDKRRGKDDKLLDSVNFFEVKA
ncbi:hypothetical protein SLEP1_g36978 [Rubroshorea leprosula]|uniref:Uncharacterized protein n=1 Tax=Rubroshorea leprosula TaxID=152421 RepID=A0AAV5KTE9_9ROSI|nr:hypothetical protein SLEP1_g36978 [Rubroshorea leprosula]